MSYFLFVDDSGHDHRDSPYEVLAGVCIHDRSLWNFVCDLQSAEIEFFGRRVSRESGELKGRRLLKRKTFRLASQRPPIDPPDRTRLALGCLQRGDSDESGTKQGAVTRAELTALAQAKISFVERVLKLCSQYGCKALASIVDRDAPRPHGDFLRKDYAYLFERFFYFLDDQADRPLGLVVFDELERSQCHVLIDQMARYFRETAKGRARSAQVIPEPFFVHSELTTAIQVADILAYLLVWGARIGGMDRPARQELSDLANLACRLRHRSYREGHQIWSFSYIEDLRPREEKREADTP
ncbi:MAG: DUF3800 domain-containing protein [Acidobacteriota bacterium]